MKNWGNELKQASQTLMGPMYRGQTSRAVPWVYGQRVGVGATFYADEEPEPAQERHGSSVY